MLLLAFDTATPAVTVALHDGTHALAEVTTVDARRQASCWPPPSTRCWPRPARPARLTAVAVGVGPGPYTGLRVGLVTARVLGSALGIPVHGICTLDVIAADALAAAGGRDFVVPPTPGAGRSTGPATTDRGAADGPGSAARPRSPRRSRPAPGGRAGARLYPDRSAGR